jgi:hypothetical protein
MLMRGMPAMGADGGYAQDEQSQQPQAPQPARKRHIGIGGILGAIPH